MNTRRAPVLPLDAPSIVGPRVADANQRPDAVAVVDAGPPLLGVSRRVRPEREPAVVQEELDELLVRALQRIIVPLSTI